MLRSRDFEEELNPVVPKAKCDARVGSGQQRQGAAAGPGSVHLSSGSSLHSLLRGCHEMSSFLLPEPSTAWDSADCGLNHLKVINQTKALLSKTVRSGSLSQ